MMIIFLSFYILVRHSDIHQAERLEEEIARFFRRGTRPGMLYRHTIVITLSLYKCKNEILCIQDMGGLTKEWFQLLIREIFQVC